MGKTVYVQNPETHYHRANLLKHREIKRRKIAAGEKSADADFPLYMWSALWDFIAAVLFAIGLVSL